MKLTEKEIRIGNIFLFTGEWSYKHKKDDVFKWNFNDWYSLGESTLDLSDVKSIEITKEWLLKFGFILTYEQEMNFGVDGYYTCLEFTKEPFYYGFYNNQHTGLYYDCPSAFIKCEYLHQLQNIYFALTGSELILSD